MRALPATLVLYESPVRAAATLTDLAETLGAGRRACLARELTKPHEEFVRDTLAALAARYADARPLGEVTLVVAGADSETAAEDEASDADIVEQAAALVAGGLSARDAAAHARRPHRPPPPRHLPPGHALERAGPVARNQDL